VNMDMEAESPPDWITISDSIIEEPDQPQDEAELLETQQLLENSYQAAYKGLSIKENVLWPNDAYREFVTLMIHYHISDNIANAFIAFFNKHANLEKSPLPRSMNQAKEVLNSISLPTAEFQKEAISISPDQECHFYYRPIINAVRSLLAVPSINENLVLEYNEKYHKGERIYEEQFNCNWWKREKLSLLKGQRLLSIIIYSDASSLDNLGKLSGHPIFISLGNIPTFQRNKPEAKALIGYLPVVKAQDIRMKNSVQFQNLQRTVFQRCWSMIIGPINDQPDIYLAIQNEIMLCQLRISQILADMAEANKLTNVFQPSTTKHPCHTCLVSKDDLNNLNLLNIIYRTPSNMKKAIAMDLASEYSLHIEHNIFWDIRFDSKS